MLWIVRKRFFRARAQPKRAYSRLGLGTVERRALPAVAPTPFEAWFQQNLGMHSALCRRVIALFNQGNELDHSDMINPFRLTVMLRPAISAHDFGAQRRMVAHSARVGWKPEHVGNLSQKLLARTSWRRLRSHEPAPSQAPDGRIQFLQGGIS